MQLKFYVCRGNWQGGGGEDELLFSVLCLPSLTFIRVPVEIKLLASYQISLKCRDLGVIM